MSASTDPDADADVTIGQLAREIGVREWTLRRVVDRHMPGLRRIGTYRLVPRSLIPQIIAAALADGYEVPNPTPRATS